MSKKGKTAIDVNSSISVEYSSIDSDRISVTVSGHRGSMIRECTQGISISLEAGKLFVKQDSIKKNSSAMHGLERALIQNMVTGVSEGFSKSLKLVGTGYRVALEGDVLDFKLMKSHPVKFKIPDGIKANVSGTTSLTISGNDKRVVGQTAAEISGLVKKDPYKGKGIYISGQYIRRKAGKNKKK